MQLDKILIPLNGTAGAERALESATELASEDTTLVLLRLLDDPALPDGPVRAAEEYLAVVEARLAQAGVARIAKAVWGGSPAAAILEAARLMRVDMIVMTPDVAPRSALRGARAAVLVLHDGAALRPAPPAPARDAVEVPS